MFRYWIFILVGIGFSWVVGVEGQQASFDVKLDTNAMLIGDHVGMKMKFTGPAASRVIWPMIPDTILGNITVIGRGKIDTTFSSDKKNVIYSQELNITCYDSGFYTIPQIPFSYKLPPDTNRFLLNSDMLLLSVHTVKVDTTQEIKPIIGPEKVPWTFREMLPWILAGILLILAIAGGIWYYRKRKQNQPVLQFKPKIVLQPHEVALQQLELLKSKKLWQSGKVKEYHVELTDILRKYIEDRFHVPALEQTTSEIIESLLSNPECPVSRRQKLQVILELADMVKFAKAVPLATENESGMTEATEFVYSTSANVFLNSGPDIKPEN